MAVVRDVPTLDQQATRKAIRSIMREHGLVQSAVARAMGISPTFFSDVMLGNRNLVLAFTQRFEDAVARLTKNGGGK